MQVPRRARGGGEALRPVFGRRARVVVWLVLAACTALPVVVGLSRSIDDGWVPIGDNAVIILRSSDVGGPSAPRDGMPSNIAAWSGREVHHPGPLVFWALAPVVRVLGTDGSASLVVVAAVRLVGSAAILAFCARRGGLRAALAAAVALTVGLLASEAFLPLRAPDLTEPLNPSLAYLPFVAVPFACWGTLLGTRGAAVVLALTASFAVQAELGYAPVVAALLVATAVGLVLGVGGPRPRSPRRWWAVGAAVLACWTAPVQEAATAGGGNLGALAASVVGGEVPSQGLDGVLGSGDGRWLVVVALVAAVVALRRPEPGDRALGVVLLGAVAGFVAVLWTQPEGGTSSPAYALAGAGVPLVFGSARLAGTALQRLLRTPLRTAVAGVVLLLWLVDLAVGATATRPTSTPYRYAYGAPADLAADAAGSLAPGSSVVVRSASGGYPVRDISIAVALHLESAGYRVGVSDGLVPYFGRRRDVRRFRGAPRLWVVDGTAPDPPVPGARPVATWRPDAEALATSRRLGERVRQVVRDHGGIELTEGGRQLVPVALRGHDDLLAAWRRDPAALDRAPAEVLVGLYVSGLVAEPALPPLLQGELEARRAAQPITAYLVD